MGMFKETRAKSYGAGFDGGDIAFSMSDYRSNFANRTEFRSDFDPGGRGLRAGGFIHTLP